MVLQRIKKMPLDPENEAAQFFVASPEDTILSKLEWARKVGRSEKQIDDAAGVLAVNPGIDRAYVERWAGELGVLGLWQEISGESR